MKKIYLIFNNNDFEPVLINVCEEDLINDYKLLMGRAIENKKDKLSIWINEQWDKGNEVLFHELQSGLDQSELNYYTKYWQKQFSKLLKGKCASETSEEGKKMILGFKNFYNSK
tara:strand:+ start:74 stop:415 length:342 start_codon:yes stop_codon:yes gene_type:complete